MAILATAIACIIVHNALGATPTLWKDGKEDWAVSIAFGKMANDGCLLNGLDLSAKKTVLVRTTPYEHSSPVTLTAYTASTGKWLWNHTYAHPLTAVLVEDSGDLIFGTGSSLYKVTGDGVLLYRMNSTGTILDPVRDARGNVYAAVYHKGLLALDSLGKRLWYWEGAVAGGAVVGPEGTILVLVDEPTDVANISAKALVAVKEGKTLWSFSLRGKQFNDGRGFFHPASVGEIHVDGDMILVGTVLASKYRFVHLRGPTLFALDASGAMKWYFTVPDGRLRSLAFVTPGVQGSRFAYFVADRFVKTPPGAPAAYTKSYPLAIDIGTGWQVWSQKLLECDGFSQLAKGRHGEWNSTSILGLCLHSHGDGFDHYNISLRSINGYGVLLWEAMLSNGTYNVPLEDPPTMLDPIVGPDDFVYSALTTYTRKRGSWEMGKPESVVYAVSPDGKNGWSYTVAGVEATGMKVGEQKGSVFLGVGPCYAPGYGMPGIHAVSKRADYQIRNFVV